MDNSTFGFSQVKLNTAFWIEAEINNPEGKYYLGKNIALYIKRSRSGEEIIEKLTNDTIDILYSAAYLSMVKQN